MPKYVIVAIFDLLSVAATDIKFMLSSDFPVFYFGHLQAALSEHDLDLSQYLLAQGYDVNELQKPTGAISSKAFDRMMQQLLALPELKYLGLEIGRRLHIAHHGAFGLAILNAPSLHSIVRVVVDYMVTRIPFIELSVEESEEEIRVLAHDLKWQNQVHRFMVEAVTMAFINLQRALNARGNNIVIRQIMLDYADESHSSQYLNAWDIDTEFDHAFSGFVICKHNADTPLIDADVVSFEQAILLCEQEKRAVIDSDTTAGKVRHFFHSQPGHLPSLGETAKALAVSQRTLHRELQREGVGFSELLDDWLSRQAKALLLAHGESIQATADKLGYAEVSNFRRAFKRWYGCSPSAFVKENTVGN